VGRNGRSVGAPTRLELQRDDVSYSSAARSAETVGKLREPAGGAGASNVGVSLKYVDKLGNRQRPSCARFTKMVHDVK